MYDIFDEQAIETTGAAPPTRIMCLNESKPRRASFSSSPSKKFPSHRSSSSMSTSTLRRFNASGALSERSRTPEGYESPSSKMPRPFVPEMKRMMPFILNSSTTSPRLEPDGHKPHIPSLPPESTENTPKSSLSESRSREFRQAQDIASKHPFDATDHVTMRMEFVRPTADVEELWVECFERWSKNHQKATAEQWRWLYDNRVLPTETLETFPTKPSYMKDLDEEIRNHFLAGRSLRSSRSLGLIENNRDYNQRPKLPPKAASLAARRSHRKADGHNLEQRPHPLDLHLSRPSVPPREKGYYAKNGNLSSVYYGSNDLSILGMINRNRDGTSKTNRDAEEISSDDAYTEFADGSEVTYPRQSIDTTVTSILSSQNSRKRYPGESLANHFSWADSDSTIRVSADKTEAQLEREPESCFEIDSDDEDDEDLISFSSDSSRNSISSGDEGFVPTPLTAIPAKAYSKPQKVQVWRTSSQSSGSEFRLPLMPEALRIPRARSVPVHAMRNQPKLSPWTSALNTPPMSPEHYSNILEYNHNLLLSNIPRSSSLARVSMANNPSTPQMQYSSYSDEDEDNSDTSSPPPTPGEYTHTVEEDHPIEEADFSTPTQESVSRQSHRDLPKVRLDFLNRTPRQSPLTATFPNSISGDTVTSQLPPPILPSQIDSFSPEDEFILHDLEKAVCGVQSSLSLSTPCIFQIRTVAYSKPIPPRPATAIPRTPKAPKTPKTPSTSRPLFVPHQFHNHPLKSHPPNLPVSKPASKANTKKPITRFFSQSSKQHTQETSQQPSKVGIGIGMLKNNRRLSRDLTASLQHPPSISFSSQPQRTTPSPPDLASFRIIFPQTTDQKRSELYAYLLAYNYLMRLPNPISSASNTKQGSGGRRAGTANGLASPFCATQRVDSGFDFPDLPTPETVITEKAAATLGIMSSEESLRAVRVEYLAMGLVERVKEGISRLVGEMDVARGIKRGRDEGYVVESTLLRTLVEHVGVCEENGWLSEENGGLWRRILVRVKEGMGIGI